MKIYMFVGPPASGKDYCINKYMPKDAYVISSDKIRGELFGDEAIQSNPNLVFKVFYKRLHEAIERKEEHIILNATFMTKKSRAYAINVAKINDIPIEAIIMATDYDICVENDKKRDRTVGEEVIRKMINKFCMPTVAEGFNSVHVRQRARNKNIHEWAKLMAGFNQENEHHKHTLLEHSALVSSGMKYISPEVGMLHDVGKLYTKSGPDVNGNCHYYSHENWSAYIYLCCCGDEKGANVINRHMLHYNKQFSNQQIEKKFFTTEFERLAYNALISYDKEGK